MREGSTGFGSSDVKFLLSYNPSSEHIVVSVFSYMVSGENIEVLQKVIILLLI